jgi:hypothetical protein
MMNARERRDLEELRAYYSKVQNAIEQMQNEMNRINLDECAKLGTSALTTGAAVKATYMVCIKKLCGE